METPIGQRLVGLLDRKKMTATQFADMIGVSKQYITQIVNGTRNVSTQTIISIAKTLPLSDLYWLLTGDETEDVHALSEEEMRWDKYNPMREKDKQISDLHEMLKQLISKIPDAEPAQTEQSG